MRKELIFCDICEEPFNGECLPFTFNGATLDVCGAQCFVEFWAKQYDTLQKNKTGVRVITGMQIVEGKKREA